MKVSELLNTYEAFKELGKKELPFETALIIAENIETLRVPAAVAIKKQNETTEKYMDRDDKGNRNQPCTGKPTVGNPTDKPTGKTTGNPKIKERRATCGREKGST